MTCSRRTFLGFSFASAISMTAERILAQGVASHTAKPVARQAPSGRPFNAHFVDVAAAAGLNLPTIYGGVDSKKYILESTGCGCAFIDYDNDGWLDIFCFVALASRVLRPAQRTGCTRTIVMARSQMLQKRPVSTRLGGLLVFA